MVTADFRPETEFTLFLRKRTKHIAKWQGEYTPIEDLFPIIVSGRRWREWQGHIFYRKLLNSCFCVRSVKYAQNSLMLLSNRHNFIPFIRNNCRWTRWWRQFSDRKQT